MPFADLFTTVQNRRVGYVDQGPRDAPPLLLLHGGGFDHAELTWKPVIAALRGHRRVVVPDLPGYGESAGFGVPHDLSDLGRWAETFMDAINLPNADVSGVSMGGGIALWLAIHAPDRVNRLIPVGAYGMMPRLPFHGLARRLGRLGAMGLTYRIGARSRIMARLGLASAYADPSRIDDATLDELMAVAADQGRRRSFDDFLRGEVTRDGVRGDLRPWMGQITAPTLLVHGRADRLVPLRHARAAQQLIPGARLEVMETGHWPMREQSGAFIDLLDRFLN